MLQDYTGSVFVPAFWSLGAEEKFYLLAPLFVFILARARRPAWQASGLVALWLLPVTWRLATAGSRPASCLTKRISPVSKPVSPDLRVARPRICDRLAVAAAVVAAHQPSDSRTALLAGAAAVVYWLVPSVILGSIDARTIVLAPALIGLCFGAMVLAAVSGSGSYSTVLGWRMWRPLATGSYTLYLTHMMVLPAAGALAAMFPLTSGASVAARWLAFVPWYLALSAASAYLLHRYVERPVLRWRDRRLHSTADSSHARVIATAA